MIASVLGGVHPGDGQAVNNFYTETFEAFPRRAKAIVSDFLIGLTGMPSSAELGILQKVVFLQISKVSESGIMEEDWNPSE